MRFISLKKRKGQKYDCDEYETCHWTQNQLQNSISNAISSVIGKANNISAANFALVLQLLMDLFIVITQLQKMCSYEMLVVHRKFVA